MYHANFLQLYSKFFVVLKISKYSLGKSIKKQKVQSYFLELSQEMQHEGISFKADHIYEEIDFRTTLRKRSVVRLEVDSQKSPFMVRGYFCVTKKRSITKHKLNLVGLKVKIHYPKQINTFLTAFKITSLYFLKNKENLHLKSIR